MEEIRIACEGAGSLPIDALKEFQGRIKKPSPNNYERLKKSILKYGFSAPVFIWRNNGDNFILDGHQRLKTLLKMRGDGCTIPLLPVDYIEAETEKEAKEKLLHIARQYGSFYLQGLDEFLEESGISYEDISDSIKIDGINKILNPDSTINDDEYKVEVPPVTEENDLWELNNHRLLCGDSTNRSDFEKLMGDDIAHMCFTDPPYGVSYSGDNNPNGRKWKVIEGDDLRGEELKELVKKAFENFHSFSTNNCSAYVCYSSSNHTLFEEALKGARLTIRQSLRSPTARPFGGRTNPASCSAEGQKEHRHHVCTVAGAGARGAARQPGPPPPA